MIDTPIKKLKESEFCVKNNNEEAKCGEGNPICIRTIKPNSTLKCRCKPIVIRKYYDSQYGIKELIFARCEKHHVTTWGYNTEDDAIIAWDEGKVTNNYNFCEMVL